jgi:RNA polymerase sigma-70 factor (ECF subfamily)
MDASRAEFQQWIEPLLERAAGYAFVIVQNREDAEDALQEAALKGYLALDRFDRGRSFKGWWFSIIRNCCLDLLRKRRVRSPSVCIDQVEPLSITQPNIEREDEVRNALQQLPPLHREILELRYFGDCSYREIATALDIPEGTVMSRLHAARRALVEVFERWQYETD